MKRIVITLLALVCALCCAFGLAACDGDGTETGTDTVAVESIALSKSVLTLEVGGEEALSVTYTPANASVKSVTWTSSAPDVASVDSTGKVKAKAVGTATVTAKTANDKTATCDVTVKSSAPVTEASETQWNAAMTDVTQFTVAQTAGEETMISKLDGDKIEITYSDGDVAIYVKEGTAFSMYEKTADGWVKVTSFSQEQVLGITAMFNLQQNMFENCKDIFKYDLFTYDDDKYTATTLGESEELGGTLNNVVVTFENGKVVEINFDLVTPSEDEDDDNTVTKFVINKVGDTTVPVPTEYSEYDPESVYKVTVEQWKAILANRPANYTAKRLYTSYQITNEYDGDICYYSTTRPTDVGYEPMYLFNGCKYFYRWEEQNNRWEINNDERYKVKDFDSDSNMYLFADYYDSFTYAEGKYTAAQIDMEVSERAVRVTDVEIAFEDGALKILKFTAFGTDYIYDSFGETSFELPPALFPINYTGSISFPAGSKVSVIYEKYPELKTVLGTWELYLQIDREWVKVDEDYEISQGRVVCKFVYNGKASEQPNESQQLNLVGIAQ